MSNFSQLVYTHYHPLDGIEHWTLRNKVENEQTWNIVVNDWQQMFYNSISETVGQKRLAVQAGGWQGVYPALLSNMFDTVYTFEPDPVNFYCLTQNCQKHNIYKFQSVLGENCGTATFEEVSATGQGRVEQANPWNMPVEKTYTVPVLSIDSLNLPDCSLIMLDVESFEHSVLLGAVHTIQKYSPVVVTEKNFRPEMNSQTINLMHGLGYRIKYQYPDDLLFIPN